MSPADRAAETARSPEGPEGNGRLARRTALEGTFEDALALLTEARDFLVRTHLPWRPGTRAEEQFQDVLVLSKLTSRLTYIMAWVLVRKTVVAGEIESEEAVGCEPSLFACGEESMDFRENPAAYPEPLRDLIDRSRLLFARVVRLEGARGASGSGAPRRRLPGRIS